MNIKWECYVLQAELLRKHDFIKKKKKRKKVFVKFFTYVYEPGHEKMCLMSYAHNKDPRSLISAFVVRCLDSIISLDSIAEISRLWLTSLTAQAGLCLAWSETPEDTFCCVVAHIFWKSVLQVISDQRPRIKHINKHLAYMKGKRTMKPIPVASYLYASSLPLPESGDDFLDHFADRLRCGITSLQCLCSTAAHREEQSFIWSTQKHSKSMSLILSVSPNE